MNQMCIRLRTCGEIRTMMDKVLPRKPTIPITEKRTPSTSLKRIKSLNFPQKTRPSITHHSNCLHSKMSSALPQFKLPLNNISCLKEKFICNVNRKRLNVSLEEEHTIVAIKLSTLQINLCCNNL